MVNPKLLREQVLLEDLDEPERLKMGTIIKELSFKKGDAVFSEGEDTKGIFLIHSGKVEISKIAPEGWKQTLAVLSKGSFFGELSIVEHRRHEANATALEDTSILLIPKEDFAAMEKENLLLASKVMKRLILVLSKNLRQMNEKFLNALISY